MQLLIWGVYLAGALVTRYFFGREGALVYAALVGLVIAVFRKPLTIALTHAASKLGLMKATIHKLPMSIDLARAASLDEAAKPIAAQLAAAGFEDAGAWDIPPLPKIKLALMVHRGDRFLAAIETAAPIGAQVNIHTLYDDGGVVSFTNSRLPAPPVLPDGLSLTRMPGVTPTALLDAARRERRRGGMITLTTEDAPRIYEQLYARITRSRKTHGK